MRPILEENVRFKKSQRCINHSSLYNYEIRPMLKENVRFKKNQLSINLSSLYNYEIRPMLKKNVRFKKIQRGIFIVTELIIDHFLERVKYQGNDDERNSFPRNIDTRPQCCSNLTHL